MPKIDVQQECGSGDTQSIKIDVFPPQHVEVGYLTEGWFRYSGSDIPYVSGLRFKWSLTPETPPQRVGPAAVRQLRS